MSTWGWILRVGGTIVLLLVLVVGGLLFYASTPHFANIVRMRVINVLEDATGGRVELRSLNWNLRHLSVEVDDLTIHGLEGKGELPYAHIDRLYARARILSLFKAQLGLDFLKVDRPSIHLIIYPDGHTNQPTPRAKQGNDAATFRTIFGLQAGRVEVADGMALVNERSIPFALTANNLGVVITYAPVSGHYLGQIACSDINLQQGKAAPIRSKLDLNLEAASDAVELKALHFVTGKSNLQANGNLAHFADPRWTLSANGTVDLAELTTSGTVDGFRRGSVDLSIKGQGTGANQYVLDGNAKVVNASYAIEYFWIDGINATTRLHITPDEIFLPDLVARPREGGIINAAFRYLRWMAPFTLPKAPGAQVLSIRARVAGVRLTTVLESVLPLQYRTLGFDTAGDGTVNIDWTGGPDDLTVGAVLTMKVPPTTAPATAPNTAPATAPATASGLVPISGSVDAKYSQRAGIVQINQFQAHSSATTLNVSGSLGVNPVEKPSSLTVHLVNDNLGEFDDVLKVLDLGFGKPGVSGIPVQLHGNATFDGMAAGSLVDPAFKGHLTANDFSTVFVVPATASHTPQPASPEPGTPINIRWDSLDTNASYSSALISVDHGILSRGKTVIHASGQLEAHEISRRKKAFDDESPIAATAQIQNASLTDLLGIVGQDLPVTGTLSLQAHAGGTLGDLTGGANLNVIGGAIEGQPYHSLTASVGLAGQDVELTKATLLQDGGTIIANGTFNLKTQSFLGNLDGTDFELGHFPQPKDPRLSFGGALKFDAHASGTLEAPSVLAGVHLRNLVLGGQAAGSLEMIVHTQGDTAHFTAQSGMALAQLQVTGDTQLRGDFNTQANLVLSNLNIAPFLRAFKVQSVSGISSIGGTISVNGPLRQPKEFSGDAEINQCTVTLQGITLQGEGPLRASLHNGVLKLTRAHITGPDTNLSLTGSADLFDGQALAVTGNGSVNMKLAQTFDSDITSSGHVDFNVVVNGTLAQPSFSGSMQLKNVAMALNDLPNGISNLNGNLVFDQNRLQVQNLVGTTGGGQLKVTGFLAYQQGLYGDFTASGKDIRVRYGGISATADTTLHLLGSQNNMLLSGNIQITRFIIGPNVDFATFTPNAAANVPPDPNAPSSHVRLDVHIFSAPQLDFQNSYAQLAGSVDLRIRGTVAQPAILGRITITDGTANFAGTTYNLQHGQIYFTNPVIIEPIIDIDATTRVEEYDVTIGLHGSINNLSPTFRSEPPLAQADVISLLALGRTQEEQALYSNQEQSVGSNPTTNALLGGALNAAVGSRVEKLFGGGSVKIDPTYVGTIGSSSARITVTQNIARNVQVTYATNVNATAQQLIQAQVDVTQSVSILAVRDEAGVFSLVLKVHKRYR
ncbi:MAG: translocation/assembly module TamB domain-containing protein [Acidobacteriaceae bacterium]